MKFFVYCLKPLFQYYNKEDDLIRCSTESEEDVEGEIPVEDVEELFKKPKKGKKGRRGQWTKHLANDLVDIILDNNKYKQRLFMTNVKNIKSSQYYHKVIGKIKEDVEKEVMNSSSPLNKHGRSLNVASTSAEM